MLVGLTVAGSDSVGGAGIQADVKAMSSLGVHAATVITCITAQNTGQVREIFPLPPELVLCQLDTIIDDVEVGAAKTGMLFSSDIAERVADRLNEESFPLVVDPVLVAGVGDSLHSEDLIETLRSRMIPLATVVTPNRQEAEALVGFHIEGEEAAREACRNLIDMGAEGVLLKGGHFSHRTSDDLLLWKDEFTVLSLPRLEVDGHGGGCTLSSYMVSMLAKGEEVPTAVKRSKELLWKSLATSYSPGRGTDIVNSIFPLQRRAMKFEVVTALREGVRDLEEILTVEWVPEVGINFVYALPGATTSQEICALQGRISPVAGRFSHQGDMDFGASEHVATIVLTAMYYDAAYRSALNVRYSEKNIEKFREAGMSVGSFDRSEEPEEVSTMEWGTASVIEDLGYVPDIIYDRGDFGKEAMIRILGENPQSIVNKLLEAKGC